MYKKIITRWIIIFAAITASLYFVLPTYKYFIYSLDPDYKEIQTEYEDDAIKLGLDLKGGLYIVLELDYYSYLLSLANSNLNFSDKETLSQLLKESIQLSIKNQSRVLDELSQLAKIKNSSLKIFFSNLTKSKQYKSNDDFLYLIQESQQQSMISILEVMRNRIENHNQYGVGEPSIQKLGDDRLVIELAGITDIQKAKEYIQRTAQFELSLVSKNDLFVSFITNIDNSQISNQKLADLLYPGQYRANALVSTVDENQVLEILALAQNKNLVSNKYKFIWDDNVIQYGGQNYRGLYLVKSQPIISSGEIESPKALISEFGNDNAGQWIVNLDMSKSGKVKWSRFTGNNIGRKVAIILDNKVFMAPTIQSKISSGGTQISGFNNKQEAEDIASILKAGELAAPINILQVNYIGPSLGQDSINSGSFSLLMGLLFVLIFMIVYYKFSGLISSIALILNLLFVLSVLITMDAVLTLPGMAGLLLTIGMTVDANVIIFERIREEKNMGKSILASINSGYDKAFITILDANLTTLLTAFVLSFIGSGPIKGFATTLSIGIICSMFTAIFITKTIFLTTVYFMNLKKLSI